jgi:thioredoxin-dependent peroxiredoxin
MKVTLNGHEMDLFGEFIQKGALAPNFMLTKSDLSKFQLNDGEGKYLLLNIFPSLDTSVCATSVRKFNQMASEMKNTTVLCISKDLPFAQKRFCTTEGIRNVVPLSDFHYSSSFGKDYGVLIVDGPMSGLLARSIVIISPQKKVVYAQLVSEITEEPDYDAALAALK